jgi:hypothetical protein
MRTWTVGSMVTMRVVAVLLSLMSMSSAGQGRTVAAAAWTGPRTPDGQPNVQGLWSAVIQGTYDLTDPRTGGGRLDEILQERSGKARIVKPSRVVDPPDGKIPYQPWAAAKQRELAAHIDDPTRPEHIDTQVRCLPTGVPRPVFFGQFRILQTPGYLFILNEGYHLYRVIPLDGRPHIGSHTKLWMGDSRGHWDGNTLVVDVTNLNAKFRLDMVGDFASDAMHVVERWTFADAKTINYSATIEDATVYTRPWTVAVEMKRRDQPDYEFYEEACHEGERSADRMIIRTDDADRGSGR